MAIIAVTGRKGGIGKSTITAHLAGEFHRAGASVLVLDADPQQSLAAWGGFGDGVLSEIVRPLISTRPAEYRREVERAARSADVVLIDTPPGFADPALSAALIADLILLPVGPSPLDIVPARDAVTVAREAKRERGGARPLIALVPSKVTQSRISKDLPEVLAAMGESVFPAIGQRAAIADAAAYGLTVQENAPRSKSAIEFRKLAEAVKAALNLDFVGKE